MDARGPPGGELVSLLLPMQAGSTTDAPVATDADTIAIGLFEGKAVAHDVEGGALQALVDGGEARPALRLSLIHI